MPLQLIRQDITRMQADAIVCAADHQLSPGGGVSAAIHRAAGPELLKECRTLGACRTGEAKATAGYGLSCKYIIHTVGPVWRGGLSGEKKALTDCYRSSLTLAQKLGCESIAFPLISAGVFGYPKDRALRTAVEAISAFLMENDEDMQVYLVVFGSEAMHAGSRLFADIRQYIDDHYVQEHEDLRAENLRAHLLEDSFCMADEAPSCGKEELHTLEEALEEIDESFSEMVLRKIKEKGMKNAECYRKANLDRRLFSKINSNLHYRPSKATAVALALALKLDLKETRELLMKAGLALSRSSKFDIIVEYFISRGMYNVFEINTVLLEYDQPLLGAVEE